MSRRKTAWDEVAKRGKSQPGKWFLHPTLVASTEEFAEHARARVKALRPDEHGRFQFHRANKTTDDLGRKVFDLYIRYQREPRNHEQDPDRDPRGAKPAGPGT